MAGKRKNGEGSWGKKTIKGTVYCYFRDKDGHYTYGRTEKEIKEKLKNNENKKIVPSDERAITVGSYVKDWLYNKKFKEVGITVSSTTFDSYEGAIIRPLYDFPISRLKLNALTKSALMDYLKQLSGKYARSTIAKTWLVISMALSDEEYKYYKCVPKINISTIKIPTESNVAVKKKEHRFTSNEDMDKIFKEATRKNKNGRYHYSNAGFLIAFIMYSGLRVAEAIGLKWGNVSSNLKMISVDHAIARTCNRNENGEAISWKIIEKSPKSESSEAIIPIRARGTEILKIMESFNPNHKDNDYIFPNRTGKLYSRANVLLTLKTLLKNADIKNAYTVHDLRHGYGSILYQEHVDILTISKLLRHSNIQTTANIYVKTTPETLMKALSKVDGV